MVDKEPKIIHFPGLDQEDTSAPAGKQAAETPVHEPSSSKRHIRSQTMALMTPFPMK